MLEDFSSNSKDNATYSASADDIAVQSYFFDIQLTSLSLRNCVPPEVLLRVEGLLRFEDHGVKNSAISTVIRLELMVSDGRIIQLLVPFSSMGFQGCHNLTPFVVGKNVRDGQGGRVEGREQRGGRRKEKGDGEIRKGEGRTGENEAEVCH
ncbi:hypothetical protein Tco_1491236 [Tanacetum coccineum]